MRGKTKFFARQDMAALAIARGKIRNFINANDNNGEGSSDEGYTIKVAAAA